MTANSVGTHAAAAKANTEAALKTLGRITSTSQPMAQAMFDLGVVQAQAALAISQSLLEITAVLATLARKAQQP